MPIAIDDRFPGQALVTLNARNPKLLDVHRLDLDVGRSTLDTQNPGDVLLWLADCALVVRAAVAQLTDGSYVVRVRDNSSSPWRDLDSFEFADGAPRLVAFSPDGRALYVITAKNANASRLVRYDLADRHSAVVFDDPEYDVERTYIDPASREILAVAVLKERLIWTAISPDFENDLAAIGEAHAGDFLIENASADGNKLVIRYQSDTAPDHFYLYTRESQRAALLFCVQPKLLDYELAPMRPISFRARDDLQIHGYLTLPVGAGERPLPAVLFVHGGPWHRDRWGFDAVVQWLANRGYAVLQVNFRGSTGYGKAFVNAGNRQWAGSMRTDLLDARDWAIAQGYADPQRFAIFGGSYGGYAVLTALAWTPDAFACGVDLVGPSDLNTFMAALPPYWEALRKIFTERVGEDPAFLKSQSPLFKASSIRVPLLIAQGANDPRVKRKESDQIVDALRSGGIHVEYVLFENEGHGLADPANIGGFTDLAESFLAKSLGGRVELTSTSLASLQPEDAETD
jgi:dipeptidyl aminopeptidase/acylaminoacyl peptidase